MNLVVFNVTKNTPIKEISQNKLTVIHNKHC